VLKNIFAKKRQMEDQGGSADKKVAVSRCSPNKSGAKQRVTHFYLTKCLFDDDKDTVLACFVSNGYDRARWLAGECDLEGNTGDEANPDLMIKRAMKIMYPNVRARE
jgi:hypothetical protein